MKPGIHLGDVLAVVAQHYGLTEAEIKGKSVRRYLTEARDLYYILGARVCGSTSGRMAAWLGGRNRWAGITAMRRANARYANDVVLQQIVREMEAGFEALAKLRAEQRMRGAAPRDPVELARAIAAGDERAAMSVSVDEIRLLAAELLATRAPDADPSPEDEEDEPEGVTYVVSPPITEKTSPEAKAAIGALVKAATAHMQAQRQAPPPDLFGLVHDFIGVEAMLRSKPSLNLRAAHDGLIEKLRWRHGESDAVDALVAAHDAMTRAEYTAAERDATERYRAAVTALADEFLKSKETANG